VPRKILVALDGSDHSAKALELAAETARAQSASISIVHVVTDRALSADERRMVEIEHLAAGRADPELGRLLDHRGDAELVVPALMARVRETERIAREAIGRRLLDDARTTLTKLGATIGELVLEAGDPGARIVATADRLGVDQIVIGARGRGALTGLVLGSVSQKVVHLAHCPCTIVK
jgi:nucleotide-binding universal stress UspA family protein